MKQILQFLRPYIKQMIVVMVLYALQSVCALFMPYIMSDIVEIGIRNADMPFIVKQGVVMIVLAVSALVCALVNNRVSSDMICKLTTDMRRAVFNKVNSLDFEQFNEIGTGSLITRSTDDIGWMEEVFGMVPYILVSAPILFVGGIILSFKGDWMLPLILLGVSAVVLLIVILMTSRLEGLWQRGDEFTDIQNRVVRERLTGIRVVRAFDKEDYEHQRAKKATIEMCNSFVRANTISGLVNPIASLLLNATTAVIIYIGAVRVQSVDSLLAGDIIATIQYIALIVNAILTFSWTISFIPHVKVSMRRISAVLQLESKRSYEHLDIQLDGQIQFEKVSFSYAQSQVNVVNNATVQVDQGQIVGIIGGTGSGKTTLLKLIMDYYPTKSGKRYFGGIDYDQLTPPTVRDNISVALQKPMIFEGTIADNIRVGNPLATEEQITQALQIAQLGQFIEENADGINYAVTQAGTNISGGQKQRISIARAILRDASVYIFDDSFSALDYLTESNLRKALNKYLKGKTQIIVTQRAATAMRCDKVYVMENGKIVGCGTHKQLLESCQTYKEIYQSQLGGGLDE